MNYQSLLFLVYIGIILVWIIFAWFVIRNALRAKVYGKQMALIISIFVALSAICLASSLYFFFQANMSSPSDTNQTTTRYY